MKKIIIAILAVIVFAVSLQAQPESEEEQVSQDGSIVKSGTLILGIRPLAFYQFGGGTNHDGQESAGFNSVMSLDMEYCFLDNFGTGITASAGYGRAEEEVTIFLLPQVVKASTVSFGVGPIFTYYYTLTDKVIPFASVFFRYGRTYVKAEPYIDRTVDSYEVGLELGFTLVISDEVGLFFSATHVRDWLDSGGSTDTGYYTSIGLGIKLFL